MPVKFRKLILVIVAAALLVLAGCSGGSSTSTSDSGSKSGSDSTPDSVDPPKTLRTAPNGLPMNQAARNTTYLCIPDPKNGLVLTKPDRPWIEGDQVVVSKVPFVKGQVSWKSEFAVTLTETGRRMKGNGLPNHPTGTFPVEKGTDAYSYYAELPAQGYNNAAEIPVAAYDLDITVPRNPQYDDKPHCMPSLVSGVVTQTGAPWHLQIAPDSQRNLLDPIAALPMDSCWGHPYNTQYHYHGYSWACFPDQGASGRHSPLFGYAIDGFGVFGPRGENGVLLTNDNLDECHGHKHAIDWDGQTKVMYHYHVNNEYPYAMGCYRGVPVGVADHLKHLDALHPKSITPGGPSQHQN